MTATTMHFGPEWMRPKHSSRPQNPPSPPPTNAHASPGMSSYSSLVAPAVNTPQEKPDVVNPFKYSKEEMLRIFKEGGGQGGLGLEVERWEGVVREVGSEPVSMKEWGDAEKKLFAGPLNSEVRRRQSTDHLSPLTPSTERPKLLSTASGAGSPLRERFLGRRREGPDQTPLTIPRKLSLSSTQNAMNSPRDAGLSSPRSRGPLTPGFDGVLSSGDAWTSRRRLSESGSKGLAPGTRVEGDTDAPEKGSGIKEEEEEPNANGHSQDPRTDATGTSALVGSMNNISLVDTKGYATDGASNSTSNSAFVAGQDLTIGRGHANPPNLSASPPGLPDPAGIEWSYVDPQGQIQGPFPAETMQKWYEGGYFNPTLLMKRTHLDVGWTPLGELAARAIGDKLFLSQISTNAGPPGLSRQAEPRQDSMTLPRDVGGLSAPYQPVPTRTLHTSALDSYFASGSTASNSPSSSFAPGRFGDHSPDPSVFATRVSSFPANGSPAGSRTGSLIAEPSAFSAPRRAGFNDSPYDQGFGSRSSIGNVTSVRTPSMDGFGLNSLPQANTGLWSAGGNLHNGPVGRADSLDSASPFAPNLSQGIDPAFASQAALARNLGNVRSQGEPLGGIYSAIGATNHRDLSRLGSRDPYMQDEKQIHQNDLGLGTYSNGVATQSPFGTPVLNQAYSPSPSLQYASPQLQAPSVASLGPLAGQQTVQPKPPTPRQQQSLTAQSLWSTAEESIPKRTGLAPFDNNVFPTASNTVPTRDAPPHQASPWGRSNQNPAPSPAVDVHSPWYSASQSAAEEGWGAANGPSSLTVSNLGQHNQQQEQDEALRTHASEPSPAEVSDPHKPSPQEPVTVPTLGPVQSTAKSPHASATQAAPASVNVLTTQAPSQEAKTPSTPSSAAPAKPVWSTEEDKKKAAANAAPSLREIQEAETRKQEARKAAERERERAARAAATAPAPSVDEAQPFTASWGLPTSKVNSTRTNPTVKDTGATAPTTSAATNSATAVWTNAVKPAAVKKTMKEIQEEEERRKKQATKETAAAAAARRAYAETTTKAATPSLTTGGAWTTVGSSGKLSAPVTPAASRPALTPAVSATTSSPARTNGTPAARPAVPAVVKAPPVASKVEEAPVAPSADFMKWLSDSLKGLNPSVNFEEITSMLLQFPLEVDPTTMEIISELIYANSTTLDGRRFAQEFVTKRKADAAARKGTGASGKQPSIADVVRSQPKPSQSEWGGFKVVNKKKKGGRA